MMEPMHEVWTSHRDCSHLCEGCPGCESPYPLGGVGDSDADVMLVGVEPAYNLDEVTVSTETEWSRAKEQLLIERKASDNPLWRHMKNVALAAGCKPAELYFTNVAKCANGDYKQRAAYCEGYLKQEIIAVDPQVLLLHGGKVIRKVGDILKIDFPSSVGDAHCQVYESRADVIPLYHWGYAYRQGNISGYNSEVAEAVSKAL